MNFCACENKGAGQLHVDCAADQRLCFRYIHVGQFIYNLNLTFQASNHFLWFTAVFLLDLVINTEDRFSHDRAHLS